MENMKEIMAGLVEVYNSNLHKTKKIEWKTDDQKVQLLQVIDVILPGSTVDMNCNACVTNALAVILCRYEAINTIEVNSRKKKS